MPLDKDYLMEYNKTTLGPWSFAVFVGGRLTGRGYTAPIGCPPKASKVLERRARKAAKKALKAANNKENVSPSPLPIVPPPLKCGRPVQKYPPERLERFKAPISTIAHDHMEKQLKRGAISLPASDAFEDPISQLSASAAPLNVNGKRPLSLEGNDTGSEPTSRVTRSKRTKL